MGFLKIFFAKMKFLSLISLLGLAACNEFEVEHQMSPAILTEEEGLEEFAEILSYLVEDDDDEEDLAGMAEVQLKTSDPRLAKLVKNVAIQTAKALNNIGAKAFHKVLKKSQL